MSHCVSQGINKILFGILSHLNFIFIVCVCMFMCSQNMYKDQSITMEVGSFLRGLNSGGLGDQCFM